MTRICTVCAHPDRQAIDKALVAATRPYRDIARQYFLGTDALLRHKADHLLAEIVAAWQEERHANGRELEGELRGWMDTLTKLLRACEEWLTDPDDPARFDLGPRAAECMVHYEQRAGGSPRPMLAEAVIKAARALVASSGTEERFALLAAVRRLDEHDGIPEVGATTPPAVTIRVVERRVRRKAPLSELLARVDGEDKVGHVTLIEHRGADPRKLIIETSNALGGHLRLLGEIVGKLQTQGTTNFLATPEWSRLEARMLGALALYPAARLALADVLSEGEAEGDADRR